MPTLAELINTVNERRQSVGKALGKLTPRQARMVADAYFPETHATNDLVKALQQQVLSLERELGRSEDLQRSCHTIIRAMRTILEQHGIECPPLPDHMKDPDLH